MHHVGAVDGGIGVGALELRVEPVDRRGLGDVERLALGNALGDVEQDDVAEFLQADEVGERAADLAGADERDLVASHGVSLGCPWVTEGGPREGSRGWPLLRHRDGGASRREKVKTQGVAGATGGVPEPPSPRSLEIERLNRARHRRMRLVTKLDFCNKA